MTVLRTAALFGSLLQRRAVPTWCVLLLGMTTLFQGCARSYGTVVRQHREAPVCCASLAELPVEPLNVGDKVSFSLGNDSPAYRFDTGKSYFRAFVLPQGPFPYRLTVDSYLVGDDLKSAYIFSPRILILDENRRVARESGPGTFTLVESGMFEEMSATGGLAHKLEGTLVFTGANRDERYLIILTTDELLREKTVVSVEEAPMLFIGSSAVKNVKVPDAPAGRLSVTLSPTALKSPPAVTERGGGTKGETVSSAARPEVVTVRLASGKVLGAMEMGRTTLDDARQFFEGKGAGLGPERENAVSSAAMTTMQSAKHLYMPPGTLHQLYFDGNGELVLFVDGSAPGLPQPGTRCRQRFPGARETGRIFGSYELQTALSPCVALIAVFRTIGDGLDSAAYWYGCPTR